MASIAYKRQDDAILLIGETKGHLGQSLYLREIEGREEGAPPSVDLEIEKRNGDFVRRLIEGGRVDTVHDISDGGLLVALAEMAMAGSMGVELSADAAIPFFRRRPGALPDCRISGRKRSHPQRRRPLKYLLEASGTGGSSLIFPADLSRYRLKAAHES
jgi:hypothetical protein